MEVKIDKGVAIPAKVAKYPFPTLQIGDSFSAGKYEENIYRNMVSLGAYYSKKLGVVFNVKKDDTGNVRVWRVS